MTEESILDFLDGNLGSSEEEELLHRLAVSPERRSLLKQHLQMRELTAALARNSRVAVPKIVTASLFTTLAANGYAGPSMPAAVESLEAIQSSINRDITRSAENVIAERSTMLFRRSSIILASIVSFIIGAVSLYSVMPEARQQQFSASVSNIFQTQNTAIPIKAEIASTLPAASASFENTSISDSKGSVSSTPRKNSVSGNDGIINLLATTEGNANSVAVPQVESQNIDLPAISQADSKYPPVITTSVDIHGEGLTAKNPFDPARPDPVSEKSFLQRLTVSFRAGEGKAPGNDQALTGSLLEVKAAYDISDIFDVKLSVGQFMPYEKQAVAANPGFNNDGLRLLQLTPVMQYRAILGAELGAKFSLFNAPFELSGGFISDLQGSIVPRLGFFTSLALQDNLSMNIGLEGMIYSHDIRSSLRTAQAAYATEHPSLIGQLQNTENTGFIGPSIEMVWHF